MMNVKELFVTLLDEENPAFVRVINALPQDKLDYRSDPKAKTALELAQLLVTEVKMTTQLLTTGLIDPSAESPDKATMPSTTPEIATAFEAAVAEVKAKAMSMTDEEWAMEGTLSMGEHPWIMPRGDMALRFLLDLIHHRGQMSTYIRPMGGKNPSIYGPSADTQV